MIALIVIGALVAAVIIGNKYRDTSGQLDDILSEVSRDGTHTTHTRI